MLNVKQWLVNHLKMIQIGFTLFVCLILVGDALFINKSLNFDTIKIALISISSLSLARLICLGLVAIIPAVLYNFILVEILGKSYSNTYILSTGFISSTLSSLSLDGVLGIASRSFFYNELNNKKKLLSSLSKIWIYSFSGLSMIASFSIIDVLFISTQSHLKSYIVWLIIATLLFPILLIVTYAVKPHYFDDLTSRRQIILVLASILKWSGLLVTIIYTGMLLGITIDIFEIIPIIVASVIIGELSFLPAGIGAFDATLILGLNSLGFSYDISLTWLVLFRLVYTVIPLLISLVLFILQLGRKLNTYFQQLPIELIKKTFYRCQSLFLYGMGILLILSVTSQSFFRHDNLLNAVSPLSFRWTKEFPAILLGSLLIYSGRCALNRVSKAFYPTVFILVFSFLWMSIRNYQWIVMLGIALLICLTFVAKSNYTCLRLTYSLQAIWIDTLVFFITIIVYLSIGFSKSHFSGSKSLPTNFIFFPTECYWITPFIFIAIIALCIGIFTYFLQKTDLPIHSKANAERIKAIDCSTYNQPKSNISDNNYFWFYVKNKKRDDVLGIKYKISQDKCIVFGDPIGDYKYWFDGIKLMRDKMSDYGYSLVFYNISNSFCYLLRKIGYQSMQIGNIPKLNLHQFKGQDDIAVDKTMAAWHKEKGYFLEVQTEEVDSNNSKNNENYQLYVITLRNKNNQILIYSKCTRSLDRNTLTIDSIHFNDKGTIGTLNYFLFSIINYAYTNNYNSLYFPEILGLTADQTNYLTLYEKIALSILNYLPFNLPNEKLSLGLSKYLFTPIETNIAYNESTKPLIITTSLINKSIKEKDRPE